jgi:beta-glucosidase
VVLSNGGVVRLSGFSARVPAIVEGWLLGQAGGGAVADVLYGVVNPSGRLAETIPVRLEDTPAFLDFPGEFGHVRYGEGVFVGYRWYDARDMAVSYPFGHGLSYTTFEYSDLELATDASGIIASVTVANTGDRDGAEVVQLYTGVTGSVVTRAPRELKAFAKVQVPAGESRRVELRVARGDLAYWDIRVGRWVVEGGEYSVEVGASSRDVRGSGSVAVDGDALRLPLTLQSTLGEVLADPIAGELIMGTMAASQSEIGGALSDPGLLKMMSSAPLGRLVNFGAATTEQLEQLVAGVNEAAALR